MYTIDVVKRALQPFWTSLVPLMCNLCYKLRTCLC